MKFLYFELHFSVEKPTPVGGENPHKLLVVEEENIAEIEENRACDGELPRCKAEQQRHPDNHNERMQHKFHAHIGSIAKCLVF